MLLASKITYLAIGGYCAHAYLLRVISGHDKLAKDMYVVGYNTPSKRRDSIDSALHLSLHPYLLPNSLATPLTHKYCYKVQRSQVISCSESIKIVQYWYFLVLER